MLYLGNMIKQHRSPCTDASRQILTLAKQEDMAHTGQPTSLCHQTLRLRTFKRVVVDGVLT